MPPDPLAERALDSGIDWRRERRQICGASKNLEGGDHGGIQGFRARCGIPAAISRPDFQIVAQVRREFHSIFGKVIQPIANLLQFRGRELFQFSLDLINLVHGFGRLRCRAGVERDARTCASSGLCWLPFSERSTWAEAQRRGGSEGWRGGTGEAARQTMARWGQRRPIGGWFACHPWHPVVCGGSSVLRGVGVNCGLLDAMDREGDSSQWDSNPRAFLGFRPHAGFWHRATGFPFCGLFVD